MKKLMKQNICILCRREKAFNWSDNICLTCCNSFHDSCDNTVRDATGKSIGWYIGGGLLYLLITDKLKL
jgi:hypothetical protein